MHGSGAREVLTQPILSQLHAAQARAAHLEQCPAERSIVSRQEACIRDLESQLDFQAVQMKRFEVPPFPRSRRGCGVPGRCSLLGKGWRSDAPPWLWGKKHPGRGGEGQGGSLASSPVLVGSPYSSCHCHCLYLLHRGGC